MTTTEFPEFLDPDWRPRALRFLRSATDQAAAATEALDRHGVQTFSYWQVVALLRSLADRLEQEVGK